MPNEASLGHWTAFKGMNEADTCRKLVIPSLNASGWDDEPHSINEQASITDGRIVPVGASFVRRKPKRVDYLLKFRRDIPLAVVEAKADYKRAGDGLGQAKNYAEILGLKFAYSTNGTEIVEFDYFKGTEKIISSYPTPDELWARFTAGSELKTDDQLDHILEPYNTTAGVGSRYYQRIAINRTVENIVKGKKRLLLVMATGTGKTAVAFQICWKLWSSKWNNNSENRKPRILYLVDRNFLVDQPKDGLFSAFGDARFKIENGQLIESRQMYFAIYQAISGDANTEGLYKKYNADFFDLIIIDECHRGSAKEDGAWREILEHFSSAVQVGMTATPVQDKETDTYRYFGEPIYQYSLKQGIEDGFLAPYKVHRIITEWDAAGWRPSKGELDRYGREIPDDEYQTKDFERVISLRARTEAIARHLTEFMKSSDPLGKTIVFCVDQEHATEVRQALVNLNSELVQKYPDYVCRVTSDEGAIGKGHLSDFQDLDSLSPVILTTSKLLTTGVDAPTIKNVVIARAINSMTEFKQIIGRGTRVRDDYGKLWFNIIDYTGSATRLFADPDFDGEPLISTEIEIDNDGTETSTSVISEDPQSDIDSGDQVGGVIDAPKEELVKYYFDGGQVNIVANLVYELDAEGNQLRVIQYSRYVGETIKSLFPTPPELANAWADPEQRAKVTLLLQERGIGFKELADEAGMPEADPFDLICHIVFNAPLRTRRERAASLKENHRDFFTKYGETAKEVLEALVEKYASHGEEEFKLPETLKVQPISDLGNPNEIANAFGGAESLREAVLELQELLYSDRIHSER